jgi:glucosamine--fructose-6-phosphate aminotransferase (isomerizing)
MTDITPFEADILDQPDALQRLADAPESAGLRELSSHPWDRIVFTGMGSSHFAGIPTWRRLTELGLNSWSVDTGQLLDTPELITSNTLVVATSQSGASGEVVELVDRLGANRAGYGQLVGIAANPDSPLAQAADVFLPLHSGEEATVSTKSYLNTLGVHRQLMGVFAGESAVVANLEIRDSASVVSELIAAANLRALAEHALADPAHRLAAVGWGNHAATALYAALITKESSKVAIEGYIGGQFRHGPFELAGPGLTVFIYGAGDASSRESLARLAQDLNGTGSSTVLVGDLREDGSITLPTPSDGSLAGLVAGAVAAELIAVELAKANGVTPGAFAFGSKITTAL